MAAFPPSHGAMILTGYGMMARWLLVCLPALRAIFPVGLTSSIFFRVCATVAYQLFPD